MLDAGIDDILIAYPIVGAHKTARLARIAERAKVSVSLDSEDAAREISAAASRQGTKIGVLIEMDVGFGRCGLSNERDLVTLAQKITDLPALEFKGLMFFPGHFGVRPEERAALRTQVNEFLERMLAAFERAGVPVAVVSGDRRQQPTRAGTFTVLTKCAPERTSSTIEIQSPYQQHR